MCSERIGCERRLRYEVSTALSCIVRIGHLDSRGCNGDSGIALGALGCQGNLAQLGIRFNRYNNATQTTAGDRDVGGDIPG